MINEHRVNYQASLRMQVFTIPLIAEVEDSAILRGGDLKETHTSGMLRGSDNNRYISVTAYVIVELHIYPQGPTVCR